MNRYYNLLVISSLAFIALLSCTLESQSESKPTQQLIKPQSVGEIKTPDGYTRLKVTSTHIGNYLRKLSFKQDNKVYLYNGELKYNQNAQFAVLDIDVGKRDLQQCADATMRLRAEYLFQTKQYDKIAFHFTSGHLASWSKYAQGYRPKISGSSVTWNKTRTADSSYAAFRNYMNLVFSYCGTRSMNNEVEAIAAKDVQPGDVIHQTGNPYGHAVTVMDVAFDSAGNKVVMLSQSYMPAQSIHILKNPTKPELSPWYILYDNTAIQTPEWTFPAGSLKRWKN